MMPDELRERILRWKDPHTDFKREAGHNDQLAKDIACFANGDGGQMIIGVDEQRNIVGVPDTDAFMIRADDVAFNRCSPPITVVPEVVTLDGKHVVVLNIAKGDQRPYSTGDGRYYVRSGVRCRRASREQLLRLFQAANSLFYDGQPLPRLGLGDLDLDAVVRHLADAGQQDLGDDLPQQLSAWGLYDGRHPTIGGVVLFGR
jgi:ATP-dependent DNA helicase RecG